MGHIHLGKLPSSRKWREVVALLNEDAGAGDVVGASARAAEQDLARATTDPSLGAAVRLLALIPQAARGGDFGARLRQLGLDTTDAPMLADIVVASASALDRERQSGVRNDFGEIVRGALIGTLSSQIGDRLPGLFDADPGDVQRAAASLGRPEGFSRAMRAFFGRLLGDTLGSWLDRTLSAEVGSSKRIESLTARDAYDHALNQYCAEATRIVREFSGAWYAKTLIREGTITPERAAGFSAHAMDKIIDELKRKQVDRA